MKQRESFLPRMKLSKAARIAGVHPYTMRRWIEKDFDIRLPRVRRVSPLVLEYMVRRVIEERTDKRNVAKRFVRTKQADATGAV